MTVRTKACVILGAGASCDVVDPGVPAVRDRAFRPPLAHDLFAFDRHEAYWPVLTRYRRAATLAPRLQQRATAEDAGAVEEQLRTYSEYPNPERREDFKHIPGYLRDLLYLSSTRYTDSPTSYILLAEELISETEHDVLFLVLNYDTLLEQALGAVGRFGYGQIEHYIAHGRQAAVVKLHGSVDWFVTRQESSWDALASDFDATQTPYEYVVESGVGDIVRDYNEGMIYHYPIITAPLAGKTGQEFVCPNSHVAYAREFLGDCSKFLIIGCSGLDNDLLSFLDAAIPEKARPPAPTGGSRRRPNREGTWKLHARRERVPNAED